MRPGAGRSPGAAATESGGEPDPAIAGNEGGDATVEGGGQVQGV